jgi:5-methylcytosine-specific restriction enzyme subunit McrC
VSIPVQNVYYLLCYAWDRLEEGGVVDVSAVPRTDLVTLFATVLAGGVAHVLRRGMDRGYVPHEEAIAGVRGKLLMAASLKTASLTRGRAVCAFDELSHDVLHNRLIKATLRGLAQAHEVPKALRATLGDLSRRLHDVGDAPVSARAFGQVQLHRNNAFYAFLLDVCELVHRSLLPDEATGRVRFRDFTRDEAAMRRLFEQFVRNFYRRELPGYRVGSDTVQWHGLEASPQDRAFLPIMRTDVTLTSPSRRVVIEAKFSGKTLTGRYDPKVQSGHLYQLFAYLKNLQGDHADPAVEGVLLYPTVHAAVDLHYRLGGHRVSVRTINLDQAWPDIHRDMLALLG